MKTTPALKPEDRISHYRVIGPLGAGGMGEVYRAKDETLERDVALKILPPALVRSEERLRRFVLEAKSASSLNHPNIVTIYEIGKAEIGSTPLHFISMELVTGETLTTKIHGEKAGLKTLLGWLAQAAEGLAKAHAAGIVHRDLKPGNIMVSHDGYAKVLDFGLAKLTERQVADADRSSAPTMTEELTSDGVVLGTIGYMSPEQVQGKPVDHRSDIFSFGCILYEAATRKQPFVAESSVETMHKILHDTPTPVEELNAQAPAELRRLIRRCLAKDANRRLDSMKALAIELTEIVGEYDALSASASSGSGAAPIAPAKRRALVGSIVGAVFVGVVGTVLGLRVMHRSGGDEANAPDQSMRMTTVTSRGDLSEAVLSPDARYLAYVSGPTGQRSLWVRQVATGSDVQVLAPQKTAPGSPRFSPDGSYLFYLSSDPETPVYSALFQIPSLGGPPQKRAFDVDSAISFAPDAKRICFIRGISQKKLTALIVLDLESGQERSLATVEEPLRFSGEPSWSPDGERIVVAESGQAGGLQARIVAIRAEDGRRERIVSDSFYFIGSLAWLPDGKGLVVAGNEKNSPNTQLWLLPYPVGRLRRVTNETVTSYWSLSVSSDGAIIATVRGAMPLANLWVADVGEGRGVRQITFASNSGVIEFDPADDGSIIFSAPRGNDDISLSTIGADGSGQRPITPGLSTTNPRCLPGGGMVFMLWQNPFPGVSHIGRADADGQNARPLTTGSGERLVAVSPDGRTVLFRRESDPHEIWAVPAAGGEPTRIASPSGAHAMFSPDGSRIAYSFSREVEGRTRFSMRIVPAAGGESIATVTLPPRAAGIGWTPDGKSLDFQDEADGASNVFRQGIDGGKPEPITQFKKGRIIERRWSPDGTRLLLERRFGSVDNLWAAAADGSNPVQITDFRTGEIFGMQWTRDGRRAVFTYGIQTSDAVLIKNFK